MAEGFCTVGVTVLLMLCTVVAGYKPVIVMHGINDDAKGMTTMVEFIQDAHPGTEVYNVDAFNNLDSFVNMWEQVDGVQKLIDPFISNATEGVNLLCYSQGGVLCRGFLESFADHNVKTLISLSSPQAGQFGDTVYFDFFFPNLTRDEFYLICYSDYGQDISFCDYWNDPLQQDGYEKYCKFLYPLNKGENAAYKTNFLALENLVLIGGPDDGVITPWQSSHFGYYDKQLNVQPYQNQSFYINDSFGLKTLDREGRIHVYEVAGVEHVHWHINKTVFDLYIEPWLN